MLEEELKSMIRDEVIDCLIELLKSNLMSIECLKICNLADSKSQEVDLNRKKVD